jgi:hypothetical protein
MRKEKPAPPQKGEFNNLIYKQFLDLLIKSRIIIKKLK